VSPEYQAVLTDIREASDALARAVNGLDLVSPSEPQPGVLGSVVARVQIYAAFLGNRAAPEAEARQ